VTPHSWEVNTGQPVPSPLSLMIRNDIGGPGRVTLIRSREEQAVDRVQNRVGKFDLPLLVRQEGLLPHKLDNLPIIVVIDHVLADRGHHQVEESNRVEFDPLRLGMGVSLEHLLNLALAPSLGEVNINSDIWLREGRRRSRRGRSNGREGEGLRRNPR